MDGALPRDHRDHAFCDASFAYCVPRPVHSKLTSLLAPKHGGDREAAGAALEVWYPTVVSGLPAGFVMGDAFRFWQGHFDNAFASRDPRAGPPKPNEPTSNVPNVEKTREYLRRQNEREA